MNVRQISAHEAVVKTASVELKTLTISGKQVTLAVFRQLMQEPIISDIDEATDLPSFNGQPWGVVNYHPDKCEGIDRHVHVVWQKGNQLRRALVRWRLPEWSDDWAYGVDQIRYLSVLRRMNETGVGTMTSDLFGRRWRLSSPPLTVVIDDVQHDAASKVIRSFKHPEYEGAKYYEYSARIGKGFDNPDAFRAYVLGEAARAVGSRANGLSSAATWELANRDGDALVKARSEYRALYEQLESLDQLFIAV